VRAVGSGRAKAGESSASGRVRGCHAGPGHFRNFDEFSSVEKFNEFKNREPITPRLKKYGNFCGGRRDQYE
jgi:hypothetical protein